MTVTTADRSEQRLVWTLVAVLTVVLAYALAGATGAGATSIVHWTGVVLLIGGIGVAGAGMSGTRDERLRLEDQIKRVRERPVGFDAAQAQQGDDPYEVIAAGPRARRSWGGGIRAGIATLGSRGIRLQGWGVACLVLGTILTAFW